MVRAVIFDMDGTLVDSERLGFKGWEIAARELGVPVSLELAQSFVGRSHTAVMELLTQAVGDARAAERVYRRHWEIRRELAACELEAKPGAHAATAALAARGMRLAVASSSALDMIEANLSAVGLLDAFDVLVCGDDVRNGKPAPDIFLLVAERLGVAPDACAVVEDSPNGVKAGHAAGMPVFLVPDVVPPTPAVEALCAERLATLDELPAAIARLDAPACGERRA